MLNCFLFSKKKTLTFFRDDSFLLFQVKYKEKYGVLNKFFKGYQ